MTDITPGTAVLSSDIEDGGPYIIHGIAIGDNDVTHGSSGIKKKWPPEELKSAAKTLEGRPLVKDHNNSVDGKIGTVLRTKYREGVGVLYKAKIKEKYREIVEDIADGELDVSIRAKHDPITDLEEDPETGAKLVSGVVFDNLSVVLNGAAPSNTAEYGPTAALSVSELRAELDDDKDVAETHYDPDNVDEEATSDGEDTTDDDEEEELQEWSFHEVEYSGTTRADWERPGLREYADTIEWSSLSEDEQRSISNKFTLSKSGFPPEKFTDLSVPLVTPNNELSLGGLRAGIGGHGVQTVGGLSDEMVQRVENYILNLAEDEFGETDWDGESNEESTTDMSEGTEEELQASIHEPEWSGTTTAEWNAPAMEDFDTDDLSEIDDHFIVSRTGFAPDNFTDLALPVVEPSGELNLNALQNAKARAGQVSGLSSDEVGRVQNMIDRLANENYEDVDFGDDEEENADVDEANEETESDTTEEEEHVSQFENVRIATRDDLHKRESYDGIAALSVPTTFSNNTMTDDIESQIDDMNSPVVIEEDDLDDLREKADQFESVDGTLEQMSSNLDELTDTKELVENAGREAVEELVEADEPKIVEQSDYDELQSQIDEVKGVYAGELEDHFPMDAEMLQNKFTVSELAEMLEETEDAELGSSVDEDEPNPKGNQNGDELGDDPDEYTEEELESVREKYATQYEELGWSGQAEKVRSGEITLEELGVEL